MTEILAYGNDGVYLVEPKGLLLRRVFEDKEFEFIVNNISLTCNDAPVLYAAVIAKKKIYCIVLWDGVEKFRGTFISEGTKYNADNDEYVFSAVHYSKEIVANMKLVPANFGNDFGYIDKNGQRFDFGRNSIALFDQELTRANFEGVTLADNSRAALFAEFLGANPNYSQWDYLRDVMKHYNAMFEFSNALSSLGLPVLKIQSRNAINALPAVGGYDDLICEYSEELRSATYNAVRFPCVMEFHIYKNTEDGFIPPAGWSPIERIYKYPAVVTYTKTQTIVEIGCDPNWRPVFRSPRSGVFDQTMNVTRLANEFKIFFRDELAQMSKVENCLDLCVPTAWWNNTLQKVILTGSIPHFIFVDNYGDIPLRNHFATYAQNKFSEVVSDFLEPVVKFSELLFDVELYRKLFVQENALKVFEIEYDLMIETTQVKIRNYNIQ